MYLIAITSLNGKRTHLFGPFSTMLAASVRAATLAHHPGARVARIDIRNAQTGHTLYTVRETH